MSLNIKLNQNDWHILKLLDNQYSDAVNKINAFLSSLMKGIRTVLLEYLEFKNYDK